MEASNLTGLLFFEKAIQALSTRSEIMEWELARIDRQMNAIALTILNRIDQEAESIPEMEFLERIDGYYREAIRLSVLAGHLVQSRGWQTKVLSQVTACLEDLCLRLERHYGTLLNLEVSTSYSCQKRIIRWIADRFSMVRPRLPKGELTDLLNGHVIRFLSAKNLEFGLTRRSLRYQLEIIKGIEKWDWHRDDLCFSAVERFLVYVNFNSKEFAEWLLKRISRRLKGQQVSAENLAALLRYQKAYNGLHRKTDLILNPGYQRLDTFINKWFDREIGVQKQFSFASSDPVGAPMSFAPGFLGSQKKLKCNVSSDQLAIYLRLLDEEQLVGARSLSQVYEVIVPLLSSKKRLELSPDAVRVKAYRPETNDKSKVVQTLQRMIKRVNEY